MTAKHTDPGKPKRRRPRLVKKTSHKAGLSPGSVVFVGDQSHATTLSTISFNKSAFDEQLTADTLAPPTKNAVHWHNVTGLGDAETIKKIGDHFSLHALVLEDIVNTFHRPKIEEFDTYTYVTLKMLSVDGAGSVQVEQVSLVLGDGWVLSFQERPGDVFEAVRERLRGAKGKIRQRGADYLFYALIDAVVDHYYMVLEAINDKLEALEARVFTGVDDSLTQHLYLIKNELVVLRKAIRPLREVINALLREDSPLIKPETVAYLRDVYDHTIQVMDTLEALRDVTTSLREMHMTDISNRMNSIMKVLTIIATIFIPITFVAGIYGMNFEVMPELKWRYGYALVWGLFLSTGAVMLWFFRRKKWL